jgi:hypothetical protein
MLLTAYNREAVFNKSCSETPQLRERFLYKNGGICRHFAGNSIDPPEGYRTSLIIYPYIFL